MFAELRLITAAHVVVRLDALNGNKLRTCKSLKIAYHTLEGHLRRAREHGIEHPPTAAALLRKQGIWR